MIRVRRLRVVADLKRLLNVRLTIRELLLPHPEVPAIRFGRRPRILRFGLVGEIKDLLARRKGALQEISGDAVVY